MTPKEKALDLFSKFIPFTMKWDSENGWLKDESDAQECALIAVNEIIFTLQCGIICIDVERKSHLDLIKHWQEVKQEIENL